MRLASFPVKSQGWGREAAHVRQLVFAFNLPVTITSLFHEECTMTYDKAELVALDKSTFGTT